VTDLEIARNLSIAALVGLAVGIEREWSGHAHGPLARFAGVRTLFLLGLIGGIAGLLVETSAWGLAVALAVAAAGLIVAAYVAVARRSPEDIDGTTEMAAILVLGLGVLAGMGWIRIATGVAAVAVVALSEKERIRGFVARIGEAEIRGAFHFAVLALVVLPLLPEGPFGPYDAVRPRTLWIVVLLISGLNYAGHIARQALGGAKGYVVTGALGGISSSTAVALAFARASRSEPHHAAALGRGTVAASLVLAPRVFALTAALNPAFAPRVGVALLPILALGLGALLVRGAERDAGSETTGPVTRNPLQLGQALRMAVAFQAVLLGIEVARGAFGAPGLVAGAAIAGLTDVDALTLSMSRLALDPGVAAAATRALTVGVVANTLLKTAVAVVLGGPVFRRWAVPGLLAMAVGGVLSLVAITG
jgi:uncharacterized membrane protein (DUF4010 family)